jgi:Protein of unknown function (DUF4232)
MMDDDQSTLEQMLRERAAQVPHLQEAPPKLLARARRRVARNALSCVVVVGLVVAGASGVLGSGLLRGSHVTPASGGTHSPTPAATTACTAADLHATASLDGAMGSVVGSIQVKNVGAATCTLTGRPTVSLVSGSSGDALSVQVVDVEPQWQADAKSAPQGWPVVSLHPGSAAAIRVSWSNECPQLSNPVSWSVELADGGGLLDVAGADTIYPPCNGTAEPSKLQVGPFEPGAGA